MIKYKFTETNAKPLKIENEIKFLKKKLSDKFGFGYDNITRLGIYKEMGWAYDFRDILKKYIVKTEYCGLFEKYHLNKTELRKQLAGLGKIYYIKSF